MWTCGDIIPSRTTWKSEYRRNEWSNENKRKSLRDGQKLITCRVMRCWLLKQKQNEDNKRIIVEILSRFGKRFRRHCCNDDSIALVGRVFGSPSCCSTVSPLFSYSTKILRKKINTSGRPTGAFAPGGFETFRTDAFWQSSDTHNNTHTDAITNKYYRYIYIYGIVLSRWFSIFLPTVIHSLAATD